MRQYHVKLRLCGVQQCGSQQQQRRLLRRQLAKGGAGENHFDDYHNRVKLSLEKSGKCCHGTILCQIPALWSAAVREPTTTTPPPPTPTWRRRSRRKPFRRLSQSGEVISEKKNTFMTHHLLNPQRTINCYFPPMCIALHCFTNVYMTKTHTHTDRVLVEMFHNYTFKECISVEKLRLWLLILTKTLF